MTSPRSQVRSGFTSSGGTMTNDRTEVLPQSSDTAAAGNIKLNFYLEPGACEKVGIRRVTGDPFKLGNVAHVIKVTQLAHNESRGFLSCALADVRNEATNLRWHPGGTTTAATR